MATEIVLSSPLSYFLVDQTHPLYKLASTKVVRPWFIVWDGGLYILLECLHDLLKYIAKYGAGCVLNVNLLLYLIILQLLFKILHCSYPVVCLWETLLVLSLVLLWLLSEFIYMDCRGLKIWENLPTLWKWRCCLQIQMFVCQT
jgi:hypothetical protein